MNKLFQFVKMKSLQTRIVLIQGLISLTIHFFYISLSLFDVFVSTFKRWFPLHPLFFVPKCLILSLDPIIPLHFPFQLFGTLNEKNESSSKSTLKCKKKTCFWIIVHQLTLQIRLAFKDIKN